MGWRSFQGIDLDAHDSSPTKSGSDQEFAPGHKNCLARFDREELNRTIPGLRGAGRGRLCMARFQQAASADLERPCNSTPECGSLCGPPSPLPPYGFKNETKATRTATRSRTVRMPRSWVHKYRRPCLTRFIPVIDCHPMGSGLKNCRGGSWKWGRARGARRICGAGIRFIRAQTPGGGWSPAELETYLQSLQVTKTA